MHNTEQADKQYDALDSWALGETLEAIVAANARALAAVQQALPDLTRAAEGIEGALSRGGRLIYIGAGTSGRLALQDAAELPPTFGFERHLVLMAGGSSAAERAKEGAEDDRAAAEAEVASAGVGADDAVIGLAASGRTPYTLAGLQKARASGAFTVGISNNPGTPLLELAHVGVLLATGAEVLAGSTRLAAGTAQKVALNALSTAVLVRLGGAYGNLMVGMKPTNAKLRLRAIGIVKDATGKTPAEAERALEACDWAIREAIVSLKTGLEAAASRSLLARHGGRVREALLEHAG